MTEFKKWSELYSLGPYTVYFLSALYCITFIFFVYLIYLFLWQCKMELFSCFFVCTFLSHCVSQHHKVYLYELIFTTQLLSWASLCDQFFHFHFGMALYLEYFTCITTWNSGRKNKKQLKDKPLIVHFDSTKNTLFNL